MLSETHTTTLARSFSPGAVMEVDSNAGASAEAIRYHYDVGTDFFRIWLDSEMVYSSARWRAVGHTSEAGLEAAQIAKLDYHLGEVRVAPGFRLLDIGCGWGAMMRRAINRFGATSVTGLTLSEDQHRYVTSTQSFGSECLLTSYEQFSTRDRFDGIVSVGALEHFAKPGLNRAEKVEIYAHLFGLARDWLKPGGRISLQSVCWGPVGRDNSGQFLPLDIFPESDVPFPDEVVEASQRYFEPVRLENGREDYIYTLEAWLHRLRANRKILVQNHGGIDMFNYYEKYLRRAIAGFRRRRMNLLRFTFERATL